MTVEVAFLVWLVLMKMTPDEKASLEILIARNAESVKAKSRKIKEAELLITT